MRSHKHRELISGINVTPFVDVMLVLLVIFMVTAPFMQQGIDINLPKSSGKDFSDEQRMILSIRKDKNIYLNENLISISDMKQKLKAISKLNPNVFLKADKDVPYGFVVEVMADVKEAGIVKLGMITEPNVDLK